LADVSLYFLPCFGAGFVIGVDYGLDNSVDFGSVLFCNLDFRFLENLSQMSKVAGHVESTLIYLGSWNVRFVAIFVV
jgi:hypothetical protein